MLADRWRWKNEGCLRLFAQFNGKYSHRWTNFTSYKYTNKNGDPATLLKPLYASLRRSNDDFMLSVELCIFQSDGESERRVEKMEHRGRAAYSLPIQIEVQGIYVLS